MTEPPAGLAAALADRYRLERELGRGGMATVWLAEDVRHGRQVAVKVLDPGVAAALGTERFLQEIATTAGLQHPNILPLFDSGGAAGTLWYSMPYVEGETLRARLVREGQLGIPDVVRIVGEVAEALDYAHHRGVIHRDLKPENILLHDGRPMVADFGIALALSAAGGERLTATGLSLGTPQYMSPEQAAGERSIDARSDVFALGVVGYEMLAGEPPFSGPNPRAVLAKVITTQPPGLRRLRDTVSPALESVVARALARAPADRFPSAGAFARALEAAMAAPGEPARAPRRRRPWPAIAVGVLAVATIGALVARRGPPPPASSTTQLTSTGAAFGPAISPDGAFLAYVTEACGGEPPECRHDLMVRDLGSGSRPTLVAGGRQMVLHPRWNADGTSLLFTEVDSARARVVRVPRLGGPREVLGNFTTWAEHPRNGVAAAPRTLESGDTLVTLTLVRAATGEVVDTVRLPGRGIVDARWSPDGRWLAVTLLHFMAPSSIVLLSPDLEVADQAPEPRFWYAGAHVRWTPRSDGLYLLTGRPGGRGALLRRPVDARRGRLTGEGDTVVAGLRLPNLPRFDVSPDGTWLAYTSGHALQELWTVERDGDAWRSRRVASSTAGILHHEITADGRTIAWGAVEPAGDSVAQRIFVAPFTGGDPRRIGPTFSRLLEFYLPRWMGDTVAVSFMDPDDVTRAALLPLGGGPLEVLPEGTVGFDGVRGGGRLLFHLADPATGRGEFEAVDASGTRRYTRTWPDSIGRLVWWAGMHAADEIPMMTQRVQGGVWSTGIHLFDPVRNALRPFRELGSLGWACCPAGLADGRVAVPEMTGPLGGAEKLRLHLIGRAPRDDRVELLPLPFASFSPSLDLSRGIGKVITSVSDIWLVRHFDPAAR